MRFPYGKRRLVLPILAVMVIVGIAVPLLLDSYIARRVDPTRIKSELIRVVGEKTGLRMSIEGVRYKFLRGLVFKGVKISPEGSPIEAFFFKSNNIELRLSIYHALSGENPFSELYISEGKMNPWALKGEEWKRVLSLFQGSAPPLGSIPGMSSDAPNPNSGTDPKSEPPKKEDGTAKDPNAPNPGTEPTSTPDTSPLPPGLLVEVNRVRIMIPERLRLALKSRSPGQMESPLFLKGRLSPHPGLYAAVLYAGENEQTSPRLEAAGSWKAPGARRMNFQFKEIPGELATRLAGEIPFAPPEIEILRGRLNIASGGLNGRGSMDYYREGLSLNVEGNYQKADIRFDLTENYALRTPAALGTFKFNTAYLNLSDGPVHAELNFNQPGLRLELRYRKLQDETTKKLEHYVHLKGELNFSRSKEENNGNVLVIDTQSGLEARGKLNVDLRYDYGPKWIEPVLTAGAENLEFFLTDDLFRVRKTATAAGATNASLTPGAPPPGEPSRVLFTSASLTQKPGANLELKAEGKVNEADMRLTGSGPNSVLIIPKPEEPVFILKQDLSLDLNITGLGWRDLLLPTVNLGTRIHQWGTAKNAPRAEDQGRSHHYQFIKEYYRVAFMDYTEIKARVSLRDMRDHGDVWPRELNFSFYKRNAGYMELNMANAAGPASLLEFKYVSALIRPMPHHALTFKGTVRGNKLAFPEILGSDKAPDNIGVSYQITGNGWLSYDLLQRTYSYLSLSVGGLDMSQMAPVKLVMHRLNLPAKAFRDGVFNLYRATSRNEAIYSTLNFDSDEFNAAGKGYYTQGLGGLITLKYSLKGPDPDSRADSGELSLRILKDDRWSAVTN